ncbi:hypothetical protein Dacet_0660 [Denitrovibrio acetiphilus DSM 12809]|uniref:Bacterial mobilisation domain-containing protein n=1 Tax=Denitrovibrio acetiphilus (strain DSM 12809 / NBRC 114555 / N2460) TaxID=522772 RepID=D4H4Q4_DENA2|nr:plasmid mobilization relaxosome protein MobC [Denitrovibrio acetiphilus]ADD67448.1 hypothetical protein Dacet_0660 [Denitrovibrio acetiphilus DSM 12809]
MSRNKKKLSIMDAAKAFIRAEKAKKKQEDKLSKQIAIKLKPADYNAIETKAKGAGVSITEYARECVIRGRVVNNTPAEMLLEIEERKLFLLSKLSNNLNQLARYCHINKKINREVYLLLLEIQDSAFHMSSRFDDSKVCFVLDESTVVGQQAEEDK